MEVFIHHIYEYEKGLRNLILHTTSATNREKIEEQFNLIHKDKKTEQILEESFNRTTNIIDKEKNKCNKIKEQKF